MALADPGAVRVVDRTGTGRKKGSGFRPKPIWIREIGNDSQVGAR